MSEKIPDGVTLILDVDSTTFNHETLNGYVDMACSTCPDDVREQAVAEVARITELGMNNQIQFSDSLDMRAEVIRSIGATLGHVEAYTDLLLQQLAEDPKNILTPSFADQADWLQANAEQIYYFSGGMGRMITPVLEASLGVSPDHIRTNEMIFDGEEPDALFVGFDEQRLLYRNDGKAQQIREFRNNRIIAGLAVMVGDGSNDHGSKWDTQRGVARAGGADRFVAFTEIKNRDWEGVEGVDHIARNLPEVISFLHSLGGVALELDTTRQAV